MAALLALVTVSVAVALRSPHVPASPALTVAPGRARRSAASPAGERRSVHGHDGEGTSTLKLVVLGLATGVPKISGPRLGVERELARGF
jgi:hypothetical protein